MHIFLTFEMCMMCRIYGSYLIYTPVWKSVRLQLYGSLLFTVFYINLVKAKEYIGCCLRQTKQLSRLVFGTGGGVGGQREREREREFDIAPKNFSKNLDKSSFPKKANWDAIKSEIKTLYGNIVQSQTH